jgi:cytochrome c oxidase cbb3-type subunit 3
MSSPCPRLEVVFAAVAALALAGCQREERDYHGPPPPTAGEAGVSPTALHVGGKPQAIPVDPRAAKYEGVAFHISEGKRYYEWYNCYGCHASGGGDIGPPFIDDRWRYGGEMSQIHASIVEGRPNGMPSFRNYIPDEQVWQIAAYIRSMGGNASKTAASSRGDEMKTGAPLTQVDPAQPQPVAPLDQPGQ